MRKLVLLSIFTLLTSQVALAECVVPMDARGSGPEESVPCIFGESDNQNYDQPLYVGPNYDNYNTLTPAEERNIIRGLNRRYRNSPSSGLLGRAVAGATTPFRTASPLSVNPY